MVSYFFILYSPIRKLSQRSQKNVKTVNVKTVYPVGSFLGRGAANPESAPRPRNADPILRVSDSYSYYTDSAFKAEYRSGCRVLMTKN